MNNKKPNKQAFTLVELIVVITILAILATIAFVSYSDHLVWSRNTNRTTQLNTMNSWLEVFWVKSTLPNPEDSVEVRASWSVIWYQWIIWKNILAMIEYTQWWKDPKDEKYFTYYVSADKKYFQLMAFLENDWKTVLFKNNNFLPSAYATDYSKRFVSVVWKKLGILTETWTNLPIQEVSSVVASWYVDIVTTTKAFRATFTDVDNITWTWLTLLWLEKHVLWWWNLTNSCNNLLMTNSQLKGKDWVYFINLDWNNIMSVYCDMTTDEGGWTLIYSAKNDTNPLNESSFVGLRTNTYLTNSKIILLANISSDIYIKDDTWGYVRTLTSDPRPITRLRNGLSPQWWYWLWIDNTVSWTWNKVSNLIWGWGDPTCYNAVNTNPLPTFYYACNNTNWAHIFHIGTSKWWTQTSSLNLDIMIK